jgi:hypothetical protein
LAIEIAGLGGRRALQVDPGRQAKMVPAERPAGIAGVEEREGGIGGFAQFAQTIRQDPEGGGVDLFDGRG